MAGDFACSLGASKCSVRVMRIVIATDTAKDSSAISDTHDREQLDSLETEAITGDAATHQFPVFRGFLASLREDSPFSILSYKIWNARSNSESEPIVFASRVDLTISQGTHGLDRQQYEDFASGLAKLLEREPGDALRAELRIASARSPDGRQGLSLRVLLLARGEGREQAQMRWSLGLVRVQQALLFEARALRQGQL